MSSKLTQLHLQPKLFCLSNIYLPKWLKFHFILVFSNSPNITPSELLSFSPYQRQYLPFLFIARLDALITFYSPFTE